MNASATWIASSRVGVKTRTCVTCFLEIDRLEHRHGEGRRLAGAGLGLAQHVAAFEQRRDRPGLNWRGRGVTRALKCLEERTAQVQLWNVISEFWSDEETDIQLVPCTG